MTRRDGERVRLPASALVPGDTIALPLSALVPADARVLSGSVLVDQSTLTGESAPVEAGVYAGSLVRRGQAVAEVSATGARTHFGRAAKLVRMARAASTEQTAILAATRNLAIVAYAYAMALPSVDLVRPSLLASIPVALPATFTLSAVFGAQALAGRGVLLMRLSAVYEAVAMDVRCADKTGTLTRNRLEVAAVVAMPGFDRERVLTLAALASTEADQDPIAAAIRTAAATARGAPEHVVRFVPFDQATRMAEAFALDGDGAGLRIVKGAFEAVAAVAQIPADAARWMSDLAVRAPARRGPWR